MDFNMGHSLRIRNVVLNIANSRAPKKAHTVYLSDEEFLTRTQGANSSPAHLLFRGQGKCPKEKTNMKRLITLISGAVLATSLYAAPGTSASAADSTSASGAPTAKKKHMKKHKKIAVVSPAAVQS